MGASSKTEVVRERRRQSALMFRGKLHQKTTWTWVLKEKQGTESKKWADEAILRGEKGEVIWVNIPEF